MNGRCLKAHLVILIAVSIMAACSDEKSEQSTPDSGTAVEPDATSDRDTGDDRDVDESDEDVDDGDGFVPWERPEEGRWWAGDLHVHAAGASNDAAPESTPERIREVAIERGVDFVVLTDHSNSTGSDPWTLEEDPALFNQGPEFPFWDKALALSDDTFLMVQGNEISPVADIENGGSGPTGHIGCIPGTLVDFDPNVAFVDRPRGEVTGGEALQQAQDVGCFSILNHPFGPVFWISYDWTSYDYDAVEVWNGGAGFNRFDEEAVKGWACDLSQDRRVVPVGGSDNHKVEVEPPGTVFDPPLGTPVTWVWSDALEWDEIISGLYAGQVSITDTGEPLEIDVFDASGQWLAMAGGDFQADQEVWIRVQGVRGGADEERQLQLIRIPQDGCDDTRAEGQINVPDPNWEVLETWSVDGGATVDEKREVNAEAGDVFFAWMVPEPVISMEEDVAISGALFAR